MGRVMFPKFRGKLFEDEDQKTTENQILGPGYRHHAPRAWKNASCMDFPNNAPRDFPMNLGHAFGHPCWVKPTLLSQTQVETLTINTSLLHSEFLVQNCGSSRGRQLWSFRRVYIFSLVFQCMFLSLVICFQLLCVTKSFQVRVLR